MPNLKVLLQWFPVIALLTQLGDAPAGAARAQAALNVLQFLAAKTQLRQDDELVRLLQQILLTDQGKQLVDYIAAEVRKLMESVNVTV